MTSNHRAIPFPHESFPVLPLRTGALFPGSSLTLRVGRSKSIALLLSLHEGDIIGVVAQKAATEDSPNGSALHQVGTFAKVVRLETEASGSMRAVLEGLTRLQFEGLSETEPFWKGRGKELPQAGEGSEENELFVRALKEQLEEHGKAHGGALEEVLKTELSPADFADKVAATLDLDSEFANELLAEADVGQRLRKLANFLGRAAHRAELWGDVEKDVRTYFSQQQREAVIREQMKALRKALGDDEQVDEVDKLRERLDDAHLPDEAEEIAKREIKRLRAMGQQNAEAGVIRNYLEWMSSLPWDARSPVKEDIDAVSAQLDADHLGLDEAKRRILEHLAVYKLSGHRKGTILCFVGPPGVGKTSIAQSIARATGREFVRIALGGVRDEAELRGHRRTYVGALPGRIIHGLRQAKARNPVVLLDEVDKLSADYRGSPEAALLEILDPEQNSKFTDHYLETPFDLSEVQFICTANSLETLSRPLRDRMDIVEISGYTESEKLQLARRFLLPKRLAETGLTSSAIEINDAALLKVIQDYTREAGVRQLDREIGRLVRSFALEVARVTEGDASRAEVTMDSESVAEKLGKPKYHRELIEQQHQPGIATGMAWTPFGGDILYIETSTMTGKGRVEITGQLGDVMKESARAALTYARSHVEQLNLSHVDLEKLDLHIHVPAGAVPKDGPSAGVTMFTAIASALSRRAVRSDTSMTGECTLRGRVLAVGGIKAKVLAAHRAGIRRIILPKQNQRDVEDVPQEVRDQLEIILVDDMSEVLQAALLPEVVVGADGQTAAALPVAPVAGVDTSNNDQGTVH